MLRGHLPKPELLSKYHLTEFLPVVKSVKNGNLGAFNEAMEKNEQFFIAKGVYLVLERLRMLTCRDLFKKIHHYVNPQSLPPEKRDKVRLEVCLHVFHWMNISDTNLDEIECILANLIYNGYIKGYLNHQHRCLVVKITEPFPPLQSLKKF